jgi:hypothetical protein
VTLFVIGLSGVATCTQLNASGKVSKIQTRTDDSSVSLVHSLESQPTTTQIAKDLEKTTHEPPTSLVYGGCDDMASTQTTMRSRISAVRSRPHSGRGRRPLVLPMSVMDLGGVPCRIPRLVTTLQGLQEGVLRSVSDRRCICPSNWGHLEGVPNIHDIQSRTVGCFGVSVLMPCQFSSLPCPPRK